MTRLLPALLLCPALLLAGIPEEELAADTSAETAPTSEAPMQDRSESLTRWQQQETDLQRSLPANQLRWLEFDQQRWLGLFLPAMLPEPLGGVLLVSDAGQHADSPALNGPARRLLSEAGWHTLAIALPELPAQPADNPEASLQLFGEWMQSAQARISHSLSSLQAEGAQWHALIGDGRSAWLLVDSLERSALAADALVLHRMHAPSQNVERIALPQDQSFPILDLLISGNQTTARQRQLEARRLGLGEYQQLEIPEPMLNPLARDVTLKRLSGWLQRQQQIAAQRNPR